MAGITLAYAEAQLALYMAAEAKVLSNQSYEIKDRKLTRANLAEIRDGVKYWDGLCKSLDNSGARGRRCRTVVVGG